MSARYNSQQVGQRVQQTKKEIEQLKEELEKLIHRGGETSSANINDDKQSEVRVTSSPQFTSRLQSAKPSNRNITVRSNQSILRSDTKRDVQESPKKVRHYNVEEAREYIRKQKEKRLEQLKTQLKQSKNIVDDRKVKLKELERKSRELVHKNVIQKRERSKSRDNAKIEQERNKFDDERKENVPTSNIVLKKEMLNGKQTVPDLIVTNLKVDKCQENSLTNLKVNKPKSCDQVIVAEQPVRCHLTQDAAATRIQQYFRKYRKRKLDKQMYEESLRREKVLEDKLRETIEYNRRKRSEVSKQIEEVPCKQLTINPQPNPNQQNKFEVPIWLQPKVEPYSYNFINTVKRKLNFAVSPVKDDSKPNVQKVKEEIKKCIEESTQKEVKFVSENLGRFLSKRCLDLDLKSVENLHLLKEPNDCDIKPQKSKLSTEETSESDTSKNIPDISTESSPSKFSSLSSNSNPKLRINTDKIKDLKLESKPLATYFGKKIEKLSSRSSDNITKRRSYSPGKSKSLSNVTDYKSEHPSPLEVPKLNLIELETSNDDLKSFLDYMSSLESKKTGGKSEEIRSDSFVSLPQTSPKSETVKTAGSEKVSRRSISDKYSSNFSGSTSSVASVASVKHPSLTVINSEKNEEGIDGQGDKLAPISIKPGEVKCIETKTNTNQIHLKFEAELHLLNDFNESMRQFMAVEKTILDLHSKSQTNTTILQNQDTQTSVQIEQEQDSIRDNDNQEKIESTRTDATVTDRMVPSINYSRGSDLDDTFDQLMEENANINNNDSARTERRDEKSLVSTSLNLSQLEDTVNSTVDDSVSNVSMPVNESFSRNMFAGFSVGMFDQLIKDEDTRIENLKTILKIREKALLDRTKGELAWLEIQKKQLIETGQLHEASLLKKKQRGIIIKLQHEKQEMQRLKQVQKQASKERKTVLKEQRNMIKAQLSNNYTIPKIKRSTHRDRRQSGPVKVYNVHRETINTETSISRRNSVAEEIIITSRSESVVDHITEDFSVDQDSLVLNTSIKSVLSKRTEEAKRSLLMREAALARRKKAAEDLLQWHQRLLEEERKIAELEMAANTIIKQAPSMVASERQDNVSKQKHNFKGSQLNLLWTNMTGRSEKKFKEDENYSLSQASLEKFCKEAKRIADRNEKVRKRSSDTSISTDESKHSRKSDDSVVTEKTVKSNSYSTDFESQDHDESALKIEEEVVSVAEITPKPVLENEIDKSKSTLNEIMQNISNITDEISAIYKLSTVANSPDVIENSVSKIPSKSEILSDNNQISDVEQPNDKTKSATIKTSEENKTDEFVKVNEGSEVIESKIDITQQLNDILSESKKRIDSILSTRTHKTSAISSEIGENAISNDNKSLVTKISDILSEKSNNQDTMNILTQSLKTDQQVDDIASTQPKTIDKILNSSDKIITDDVVSSKTSEKISDFKSDIDLQIDKILNEGHKRISDILSSRSAISTDNTIKDETKPRSDESTIKSDVKEMSSDRLNIIEDSLKTDNITQDDKPAFSDKASFSEKIKSLEITDINDQMEQILSSSTKKISDILNSRSKKSSDIVTQDDTVKTEPHLVDSMVDVEETISNHIDKTSDILSEDTLKMSQNHTPTEYVSEKIKYIEKTDISEELDKLLSDSTKKISDILNSRSQKSSAIVTQNNSMQNKAVSHVEDSTIKSDVKETSTDLPDRTSDILSRDSHKMSSQSDTMKNEAVSRLEGSTIKSDLKETISDRHDRTSDIFSEHSHKMSSQTQNDTMKNEAVSRLEDSTIKSHVKEAITDLRHRTSDILSDDTLKMRNQNESMIDKTASHSVDSTITSDLKETDHQDITSHQDITNHQDKTSDILSEDFHKMSSQNQNKTIESKAVPHLEESTIKSDVKEIISDRLTTISDILNEDSLKMSNQSQNDKTTEYTSEKIKSLSRTDIDEELDKILSDSTKKISDILSVRSHKSSPVVTENNNKTLSNNSSIKSSILSKDMRNQNDNATDSQNSKSPSNNTSITSDIINDENNKPTDSLGEKLKSKSISATVLKSNNPTDTIRTKTESLKSSIQLIKTLNESVRTVDEIQTTENSLPSKNNLPDASATLTSKLSSNPNEPQVEINYSGPSQNNKRCQKQKSDSIINDKLSRQSCDGKPEIKLNTLSDMSSMKDEDADISNENSSVIKTNESFKECREQSEGNDGNTISKITNSGVVIFKPLKISENPNIVSLLEEISQAETGGKTQTNEISSIVKTDKSSKDIKSSKHSPPSNIIAKSKIETMNEINSQITSSKITEDLKINGHTSDTKLKTFEDDGKKSPDSIEEEKKSIKIDDDDTTASSISTADELSHSSDLKPDNEGSNDKIDAKVTDTVDKESKTNNTTSEISKSEEISNKERSTSGKDSPDFVDVKKRVSEILADAHSPRGDKSPRLQDIYTTTYDILTPDRSPEMGSPVNSDKDLVVVNQLFGEEAEALLRKQLAIEQEIKQLEQQQKEQIPYLYMREIPNKPPPPYTPPQPLTNSIVPASVDQLDTIVCSLSRILHISYFKGTLETSTLSERDKRTFTTRNNVEKECYEFVFDICKELAVEHYKQFKDEPRPSWMKINKKPLAPRKPYTESELREYLFKETKVLLGFEKVAFKENIVTKWSRKKRDHVDEILVMESQAEESEWTNYDEDEVMVKDELTNDIMNMLLAETAHVFQEIFRKKRNQNPS